MKVICPRRVHDLSIYLTGRGINSQNFDCDSAHLSSDVSVMVHDMDSVNQLGAMRDSVELAAEFTGMW